MEDASIGIIAFGSTDPDIEEARVYLAEEDGVKTDYLRVRALPLPEVVKEFVSAHERVYVIEMNHTGQLHQILKIEYPDRAMAMTSLTHNDGLPISARWVREAILAQEVK